MKKLLLSLVGCVIAWMAGESSAQAAHSESACDTNPDYIRCYDADTWTANCTSGAEELCWIDNGFASDGLLFRHDSWRQFTINPRCQAAVGNGCFDSFPRVGSTGSGYSYDLIDPTAVKAAPYYQELTFRYYTKASEGYPSYVSHGPAIIATTGASGNCSTLAMQPLKATWNVLYTTSSTCGAAMAVTEVRMAMNQTGATTDGICRNERWCRIEIYLKAETSVTDADADNKEDLGECNGILRMWVNDTLVMDYSTFCFGFMSYSGGTWSANNSGWKAMWPVREYTHREAPWGGHTAIDNIVVDIGVHSGTGPYIGAAANENFLGTADPNSPYFIQNAAIGHWACYNDTGKQNCANNGASGHSSLTAIGTWGTRKTLPDCSYSTSLLASEATGQWANGTSGSVGELDFDIYAPNSDETVAPYDASTCTTGNTNPLREASLKTTVTSAACISNATCGQGLYWAMLRGSLEAHNGNTPSAYVAGTCGYLGTRSCGPSFMPKVRTISGWIYIPSSSASAFTNCETGTLIAGSAFPTAQPCPALPGFGGSGSGNGGYYLSVTRTAAGNFAVVQRHNNSYTKRALYDSGVPISLDTWHRYELIAWVDLNTAADRDKVSLMLDGTTVIDKQALTYTIASDDGASATNGVDWLNCKSNVNTAAPSVACQVTGVTVDGITSNQTGYDLTIYTDQTYVGTMSFYSCSGWGTWCPFETHKVGNLGGL